MSMSNLTRRIDAMLELIKTRQEASDTGDALFIYRPDGNERHFLSEQEHARYMRRVQLGLPCLLLPELETIEEQNSDIEEDLTA